MFARFSINYQQIGRKTKREMFNFKNKECQQKFFELTDNSTKFASCFREENGTFIQQSNKFMKQSKSAFHQCFKKIRISNKTNIQKPDIVLQLLETKTKLQMFLKSAKTEVSKQFAEAKICDIEDKITQFCSTKNVKIINEQLGQINTLNGSISQIGIWKVKSKLLPRPVDPPMAKRDFAGNLITGVAPLKQLYLDTYVHRLRHREIREELKDLYCLKTELWS